MPAGIAVSGVSETLHDVSWIVGLIAARGCATYPVMRKRNRQAHYALVAGAVAVCLLGAGKASSPQGSRSGFYVGVGVGIASSAPLGSSVSAVTTPTKCDTLLYLDPSMAPSGAPECRDTTPKALSSNGFEPSAGFTGGLSAGYAFAPLRVEFEYRARSHGDDASLIIASSTNQAVVSKASEWSPVYPPTEVVSSYRAHQFFANLYYDFANDSRWTPFVGAGAGTARTNLHYSRRLLRKTIAQGYQDVDPPLSVADRPAAAAGTFSLLDTPATGTLLGFQVLGGMDYAVGERTSIGINAHWARFGDITEDVVWSIIRSHAPVRADGVTPFSGELTLDSLEYWAVTLELKYRF